MVRARRTKLPLLGSVIATLLLLALAGARPAEAQEPAPKDGATPEERRTAIYHAAVDAAAAGRWADAKKGFAEALAIRASAKVFFSLAQAETQLGQVASAEADYARASEAAKSVGEADVVRAAEREGKALSARVPHLHVTVVGPSAATASATATIDDLPVAVDAQTAVDPGAHRVIVSAPGMSSVTTSVVIGEGQLLDVPVRLESPSPPPAAVAPAPAPAGPPPAMVNPVPATVAPKTGVEPSPGPSSRLSPWKVVALVAGGGAVVSLGVGTYLGLDAKSKNDQSNQSGCDGDHCTSSAATIRRSALFEANASTAAFVIGGALAAAGVVVWFVAPSPRADSALGVSPTTFASGGGLLMSGRW
jgi:hypothetical protein